MRQAAGGWDVFLPLIAYLLYVWRVSHFFRKHLKGTWREEGVFAGLLLAVMGGLMALYLKYTDIPYILYAMCSHGVFVGLVMAVFRDEREKKLLAAVILLVMGSLILNFSESFLCCLGLILTHMTAGGGQIATTGVWTDRIIMLMTYGAGTSAIMLLSKPLEAVFEEKRKSWYLSLSMSLFCTVLVTDLANWAASNGILVQDWGRYGLYGNQLISHSAMCMFTGLAMAAAGALVFGMERMAREERAGEEYRSQVMCYQMMEEQYRQTERLRHDIKNHVIALQSLVQNRQWEKAGSYLREMAETGGVEAEDEVTGSLVIDALLYHKRRQAAEKKIRWQCDARLSADCPVKETDLCIIVGNILDNALEACFRLQENAMSETGGIAGKRVEAGDEPFIRIYMGTVKKCLFLEVQNSTDLADSQEILRSRKENPGVHGLGLRNIQAAAEKYNGAVHTEAENGVFTISILLPLYQQAQNTL